MKSEALEKAVRWLMEGDDTDEMRGRARVLASKAIEEGWSSHSDLNAFIEELRLTCWIEAHEILCYKNFTPHFQVEHCFFVFLNGI